MVALEHYRAFVVVLLGIGSTVAYGVDATLGQNSIVSNGPESAVTKKLIESARLGSARYLDSTVARADGYQRIGPETPAMGEHWIHVGLLFEPGINPAKPEILSYITTRRGRILVGVGYAVPLLAGEAPPLVTGLVADWHDHSGEVEEELLGIKHDDMSDDSSQSRVAVVHAWIWTENPAGLFVPDNWALPFLRLGWDVPTAATVEASKAISLVTGEAFYDRQLETMDWRDKGIGYREVIGRGRQAVKEWIASRVGDAPFTSGDAATLGAIWNRTWDQLDANVSPESVERLRRLRGQ